MLGIEGPGLELDALEAVVLDHPPGLGNDLLFVERLAPTVGRVRRIDVLGVLEKQVRAERNLVANRAAQQVHQRYVQVVGLQIQASHFERRIGIAHRLARVGTRRQFGTGNTGRFLRGDGRLDDGPQLIEVERIQADQLALQLLLDRQGRCIAIALPRPM